MWNALIIGITMGLYLAVSVGPLLFTVIKQSLINGIRGGFSFVAGIWLSDILFVLLSNVFTVLTAHFADVYIRQIGYGGGVLLLGLGCYYSFFKHTVIAPIDAGAQNSIGHIKMARLFATGFLINTLNPILFFEWLTAATIIEKAYSVNYRILIFSACLAVNIFSDVLKVMLATKIKPKLTVPNLHLINRITGVVLIFCGGFLLYQTFYHADKWGKKEVGEYINYHKTAIDQTVISTLIKKRRFIEEPSECNKQLLLVNEQQQ
jgi:threonine/homoserine/homoserine lactone efflux protein